MSAFHSPGAWKTGKRKTAHRRGDGAYLSRGFMLKPHGREQIIKVIVLYGHLRSEVTIDALALDFAPFPLLLPVGV
jgi:hypothetical protein